MGGGVVKSGEKHICSVVSTKLEDVLGNNEVGFLKLANDLVKLHRSGAFSPLTCDLELKHVDQRVY